MVLLHLNNKSQEHITQDNLNKQEKELWDDAGGSKHLLMLTKKKNPKQKNLHHKQSTAILEEKLVSWKEAHAEINL